jgi:hypothetical protein
MPDRSMYPQNSNPLAPSWRVAQYGFPEIPAGYCIRAAAYFKTLTLAPDASLYAQELAMDRASDFIWNEWRFSQYGTQSTTAPNIKIRLRDSRGRRVMPDVLEVPQTCGMLPLPMMFPRGSSLYIDATADDAGASTITFQLAFRGFKRFKP